jgi:hypothetical protein
MQDREHKFFMKESIILLCWGNVLDLTEYASVVKI